MMRTCSTPVEVTVKEPTHISVPVKAVLRGVLKERFGKVNPAIRALAINPKVEAVRKPSKRLPIAYRRRLDVKYPRGLRCAAKGVDNVRYSVHAAIIFRLLEYVKWLERLK
jgi:hypothetical protein